MSQGVKRPYHSARRREQADETRRRIIGAAQDLFVTQGYGRTTIAEVAREAGVAVETVYAAYGNKATLYFECLWMDTSNNTVGAHAFSDMKLAKSRGKWLVENIRVGKVDKL